MKCLFCFLCLAASLPAGAQTLLRGPEGSHLEVMGSGWLVDSGGQIQASGTPADLRNDLGVRQQQATFFGRLVVKLGRRQRIEVEGTPYRLDGLNIINRTILFRGQTFNVNQTVASNASLDYVYAGFRYDLLTGSRGHFGLSSGGAYLSATGTLSSVVSGLGPATTTVTATRTQTIGLPLAGFDFRIFPLTRAPWLEVEGGMRGMNFGHYGYYAQAMAQGGVSVGPFAILAGYRAVNTSISVTDSSGLRSGVTARFRGPIFSGVFRW